ncbi:MAG: hypothetical protein NZM11_07700 [Anaerolineales bacterium]|nr:hypothetical protein [Anaerolineales bacterium]
MPAGARWRSSLACCGLPLEAGRGLLALAAFGLSVVSARLLRQHPVEHVAVMTLGALAWLIGNVLWLGRWLAQAE